MRSVANVSIPGIECI